MKSDVLEEIIRIKEDLPKKQKMLCNYLVMNYGQIGIMTVAELAEKAGVGPTTVMRLVQSMGYDSFISFKRALAGYALTHVALPHTNGMQESRTESSETLRSVLTDGESVLESLYTPANVEQFEKAVQMMLRSRHIYVMGLRSSKAVSLYFDYLVDRFYPKVRQLSQESEYIYDKIVGRITPEDVLLVFATYPSTKKTVQMVELCHDRKIPLILVINTRLNPMAKLADAVIDSNSIHHPSGNVALFAIVEAFALELGRRTALEDTDKYEDAERNLLEHDILTWGS